MIFNKQIFENKVKLTNKIYVTEHHERIIFVIEQHTEQDGQAPNTCKNMQIVYASEIDNEIEAISEVLNDASTKSQVVCEHEILTRILQYLKDYKSRNRSKNETSNSKDPSKDTSREIPR